MAVKNVTISYGSWTSLIACQVLAKGGIVRATLDATLWDSVRFASKIGRGGTTALTNGVNTIIYPVLPAAIVGGGPHPALYNVVSSITACNGNTTVGASNAVGGFEIFTAAVTNFAAGDLIIIQDAGGGVTRTEWNIVAKTTVASGTGLTLVEPLQYVHTLAQADTVRNKADVYPPCAMPGGYIYHVAFDYSDDAAGESVTVAMLYQAVVGAAIT